MTLEDLMRAAGTHAPQQMHKVAAALSLLEEQDAEAALELRTSIKAIGDYTLDKVAASPAAMWGAAVGTSILAGIGANMAGDMYDAAKRSITSSANFNNIMKMNPELKAFPKDRLRASFNAIHRFGPELTSDPLVGGALLKNVAELPGNEAMAIKDILQSRKNIIDSKKIHPGVAIELPSEETLQEGKWKDLANDHKKTELKIKREEMENKKQEGAKAYRRQVRLKLLDHALSQNMQKLDGLKSDPTVRRKK